MQCLLGFAVICFLFLNFLLIPWGRLSWLIVSCESHHIRIVSIVVVAAAAVNSMHRMSSWFRGIEIVGLSTFFNTSEERKLKRKPVSIMPDNQCRYPLKQSRPISSLLLSTRSLVSLVTSLHGWRRAECSRHQCLIDVATSPSQIPTDRDAKSQGSVDV